MKRLFTLGAVLFAALSVNAATTAYSISGTAAKVAEVVTTNRMVLYSLEVTGPYNVTVELFDNNSTNAPYFGTNYVNSAYSTRVSYATNVVSSFVGYNGYTNWYTNANVINTYTVTNAANTNAMSPLVSAVVAGNTYAVYSVDAIFERGVCIRATTNASVVLTYR